MPHCEAVVPDGHVAVAVHFSQILYLDGGVDVLRSAVVDVLPYLFICLRISLVHLLVLQENLLARTLQRKPETLQEVTGTEVNHGLDEETGIAVPQIVVCE